MEGLDLTQIKKGEVAKETDSTSEILPNFVTTIGESLHVSYNQINELKRLDKINKQMMQTAVIIDEKGIKKKEEVNQAIIDTSKTNQRIVEQIEQTNQQLIRVNDGLSKVNISLEKQLSTINSNIDFLINSIGGNEQRNEEQQKEIQRLLIELQILVQEKDERGLKNFIDRNFKGNGIALATLILQGLSIVVG